MPLVGHRSDPLWERRLERRVRRQRECRRRRRRPDRATRRRGSGGRSAGC